MVLTLVEIGLIVCAEITFLKEFYESFTCLYNIEARGTETVETNSRDVMSNSHVTVS
jgi:hypothetical protein